MATTNITITSSDTNNKSVQKTITGINPDATSAQLVSTAQKIVALTDNTYVRTDRVDKTNCDTEASGDMKQTPTLTVALDTLSIATYFNSEGSTYRTALTYDGDGELFFGGFSVEAPGFFVTKSIYEGVTQLKFARVQETPVPCTFKVLATETATYKAAEITVTITA